MPTLITFHCCLLGQKPFMIDFDTVYRSKTDLCNVKTLVIAYWNRLFTNKNDIICRRHHNMILWSISIRRTFVVCRGHHRSIILLYVETVEVPSLTLKILSSFTWRSISSIVGGESSIWMFLEISWRVWRNGGAFSRSSSWGFVDSDGTEGWK